MTDLYILTLTIILLNEGSSPEELARLITKAIREELYQEYLKTGG